MKVQSKTETQPIVDAIYRHQLILDQVELQLVQHYALTAQGKKGLFNQYELARHEKQMHDSRNIIKQLESLL